MSSITIDKNLEPYRVGKVPNCYYIPNYLTKEQEQQLIANIYNQPPKTWKNLRNRRLQSWGGTPHPKGMFVKPLPDWLNQLHDRFYKELGIFKKPPNHVLINEYKVGQGIMAHKDGPVYEPIVANLSLCSTVLIQFNLDKFLENQENRVQKFSLVLEPRALIVFSGEVYNDYLHHIEENSEFTLKEEDNIINLHLVSVKLGDKIKRDTRISTTHRIVKKVISGKLFGLN